MSYEADGFRGGVIISFLASPVSHKFLQTDEKKTTNKLAWIRQVRAVNRDKKENT